LKGENESKKAHFSQVSISRNQCKEWKS